MRIGRIPGALPGILFFFGLIAHVAAIELAVDLFAEGDWIACRRECKRMLVQKPDDETRRLLDAVCWLRLTNDNASILSALGFLAQSATNADIRAMAAYELGRIRWSAGDSTNAFVFLRQAFVETSTQDLFLRAGCSLDLLVRDFPILEKKDTPLFQSLKTSRVLWTPALVKECVLEQEPSAGLLSRPGQWVVSFYREMIRPAIGSRCALEPSCSEYFRQASLKHGLLGWPIQADRFIREPSVVQAAERPIPVQDEDGVRYDDPISDHDEWMKK